MKVDASLNFRGLFGDQQAPFIASPIHYEPLQKRSQLYNYEIREHLHSNLFQIFLITSGGGMLLSGGERIKIETPCILTIPSNTLHGFAFQSEVRGEVFTFSEQLFESWLQLDPALFSRFEQLQYLALEPASVSYQEVSEWKNKLIATLQSMDQLAQFTIPLLVQLLLIAIYRVEPREQSIFSTTDSRTLKHFKAYRVLLKQYGHKGKGVSYYAQALGITGVHLNRVCKTVVGQTALRVAHEYLINEALKYLHSTTYSVAEVAYFLGFKDPAHFSKLFKKIKGVPPGRFRKVGQS